MTSATSVRSRRLRSLAVVVGACHRADTSVVRASNSERDGSGEVAAWLSARALSASVTAARRASQRDSKLRATRRFSGSQAWNARSARSAS